MQTQSPKSGLFRRTPPAIFPPILGLFGLGLAWRRAADGFLISPALGDIILGAVTLLFLFSLIAYAAKFVRRPGVLVDDLKTLPGRAGLAAMSLSGMLLAASMVTYSTGIAFIALVISVAIHATIAALVIRAIIAGPSEARHVTPVWHLLFVAFVLSTLSAIPLGYSGYSMVVFALTFLAALGIWGVSLSQHMKKEMPAPLRPVLVIHLAPASVLGTAAYLLGNPIIGFAFGIFSLVIAAWLLFRLRWITQAGFSPFWGAFTFPLAAFSTLMQIMGAAGDGEVFRIIGGISLIAGTLIIPVIAWKILKLWMKGVLAVKTNAAEV